METRRSVVQGRPALTVGQQSHDPQVAKLLEVMLHGAVTIAQLVQVSEHVVDSCIVYATAAAAALFGFARPRELVGQFISKVHHPDDALVTRHYALARLYNEWCPNPYPMRILRAPSLEPIPVVKHVTQVMIDGILTWITVHTPFDYSRQFLMPVTSAMIDRAGSTTERQVLGLAHVAYMDQMIQSQGRENPRNFARVIENSDTYLTYTPKMGNISQETTREIGNVGDLLANTLEALLTAHTKRQRNVCFKCAWPWYSKVGAKRPNKCPSCGDKNWDRPYTSGHLTGRVTDKADEHPR
jgi:hypothetical protein